MELKASVILSTYNQPVWLDRVLFGYQCQSIQNFEVVIADDGSTEETRAVIDKYRDAGRLNVQHVWQEDDGFQKCRILNKAIVASKSDYLIFTDGDCVPREDFVATHLAFCAPRTFLSGGYYKLPMNVSHALTEDDIQSGRAFDRRWLRDRGCRHPLKLLKLVRSKRAAALLEWVSPTRATWNGQNSSGWKTEILAANGFDTRMGYGGEDRELGERLIHAGVQPKRIRYSAACIHLEHPRGYVNAEIRAENDRIRAETARQKRTRTSHGIDSST